MRLQSKVAFASIVSYWIGPSPLNAEQNSRSSSGVRFFFSFAYCMVALKAQHLSLQSRKSFTTSTTKKPIQVGLSRLEETFHPQDIEPDGAVSCMSTLGTVRLNQREICLGNSDLSRRGSITPPISHTCAILPGS